MTLPAPASPAEREAFQALQARLPELFREVFQDRSAPRTVVVCPGLSIDPQLPATQPVLLTSKPNSPTVIDYHLSLLSGPAQRACQGPPDAAVHRRCIADTPDAAEQQFVAARALLDRETG